MADETLRIEVDVKKEPKVGSALDNSEIVKRAKREALPLIASTPVENSRLAVSRVSLSPFDPAKIFRDLPEV